MKNLFFVLLFLLSFTGFSQEKRMYYQGDSKIDASLIDENVRDSVKKVNTIFHFKNGTRSHYIKVLNLAGKTYAQGISEYVVLDFNSKKGGDLHRKVENLTHIKIENGKFTSDQLKFSFAYLKEPGVNYVNSQPPIKIMVCSKEKSNSTVTSCRLNDDEVEIVPSEFPGKYPQSSFVRLGAEDLKNMKAKDLDLMKKEIYARYGYRFPDKSDANYFFSQNWYEPIVDNKMIELNEIEIDNMAMIDLYLGGNQYRSLNDRNYSYILPLETTSATLYDKDALKNVKYIKQDSLSGNKCLITNFNKQGISISQQNCMINQNNYVNYFSGNFIVQHTDRLNDTFYYYNDKGLPSKTVRLDYKTETTEETYFTYDSEGNITKKDIYQNNDFNSTLYYDYDSEGNLVKEYYKDEEGKEQLPVEFFYDEDNVKTGYLKNKEYQCDYSYNDKKDVLTKAMCYKIAPNDVKEIRGKTENTVLETNRGKQDRLLSFRLREYESYKYSLSATELSYY